jgi:hypothetical protein
MAGFVWKRHPTLGGRALNKRRHSSARHGKRHNHNFGVYQLADGLIINVWTASRPTPELLLISLSKWSKK